MPGLQEAFSILTSPAGLLVVFVGTALGLVVITNALARGEIIDTLQIRQVD